MNLAKRRFFWESTFSLRSSISRWRRRGFKKGARRLPWRISSLWNLRVFYMGLCGVEKVDGKKGIGLRWIQNLLRLFSCIERKQSNHHIVIYIIGSGLTVANLCWILHLVEFSKVGHSASLDLEAKSISRPNQNTSAAHQHWEQNIVSVYLQVLLSSKTMYS